MRADLHTQHSTRPLSKGETRFRIRGRALQDETGGFQAFIPLAFHPDNNQMRKLPAPSAADTLRVHAVARIVLDNIARISRRAA